MVLQRYLNEFGVDASDLSGVGFTWKDEAVPIEFGNCGSWLYNSGLVDDSRHGIGSKSVCGVPIVAGDSTTELIWDSEGNIKTDSMLEAMQKCDGYMSSNDPTQTQNLGPDYDYKEDCLLYTSPSPRDS